MSCASLKRFSILFTWVQFDFDRVLRKHQETSRIWLDWVRSRISQRQFEVPHDMYDTVLNLADPEVPSCVKNSVDL